ncbi:MAG: hypothetical protein V1723_00335 [Candidatus Uhrbacteria bacterium]
MTVKTIRTLRRERVISFRDLKRNPAGACRGITRIVDGARTRGFVLSPRVLDDLIENLEALSSPQFLASIRRARRDVAHGRTYTLDEVKRELGIR